MSATDTTRVARIRRHVRIRKKVAGTPEQPRLAVFRSGQHIYAQVIDDRAGRTLAQASISRQPCATAAAPRPIALARSANSSRAARKKPASKLSSSTAAASPTPVASRPSPMRPGPKGWCSDGAT